MKTILANFCLFHRSWTPGHPPKQSIKSQNHLPFKFRYRYILYVYVYDFCHSIAIVIANQFGVYMAFRDRNNRTDLVEPKYPALDLDVPQHMLWAYKNLDRVLLLDKILYQNDGHFHDFNLKKIQEQERKKKD